MKYVTIPLALLIWFGHGCAFGQHQLPKATAAAKLINRKPLTDRDILAAKDSALQACASSTESPDAYTWLVKGFVYKEVFKIIDQEEKSSENRDISAAAIENCIELDKNHQYTEECFGVLEYLSRSYLNDALRETRFMNIGNLDSPEILFGKFKKYMLLVNPNFDFKQNEFQLNKQIALGYSRLYERNVYQYKPFIQTSIAYYKKALEIDSSDYDSNCNIGISYYNQGVYLIRKIGVATPMDSLIKIQDACVNLFRQAIPYMTKAYQLQPESPESLKGLWAIHRALSDEEKSEFFKGELERINRKQ